jgi:hypothetical protein
MTRIAAFTMLFLSLILHSLAWAQDEDIVVFDNGDRLTGEVKSLERGLLRFKTGAAGTISIEWDNVAHLSSTQNIQVETIEGLRYLGALYRSAKVFVVTVETESGPIELDASRVVKMSPIEETVDGRLDGDIYAGYSFTKATEVKQVNAGFNVDYRTELRIYSLTVDATLSDTGAEKSSQRINGTLEYTRLWQNRWLTNGILNLTRNDELGIDLRTWLGVGGGRIVAQSNESALIVDAGLALSRENVAGGNASEDSLEAYGRIRWDWFHYDFPELDLASTFIVFPSLTESGRVRGDFDITFRWEFIEDLSWRLSFYDSFDSNTNDPEAASNDYGVNTSLSWEF